ncbi:MAG: ABC transporter ATP-binding protein [Bacteroidetes bacterium]|nr:ABC transporter ATP-binding protein [Bacteroidota bacterium]
MTRTVIEISNLGKQYRLGQIGTGSIADDFKKWWYQVRGKENPFLKVGEENDRSKAGKSDYVWALRDVNLRVNEGDVMGIIGKNGAGKSTLLKILSRTTAPTVGEYKIRGRVASLLEVGTGFHPDLSGRENIFLNGAILGMKTQEIRAKFDEIVDFSGVERYIDTPVKRYSSGMYVRLAFAVAAHLDPEILIVDEVLAVGDQEFQDKCLGKMKSVSAAGRTVLFVSHNLVSIKQLCTKAVFMKNGTLKKTGATTEIIEEYLNDGNTQLQDGTIPEDMLRQFATGDAYFRKIEVLNLSEQMVSELAFNEPFKVKLLLEVLKPLFNVMININICNTLGEPIAFAAEKKDSVYAARSFEPGYHEILVEFDLNLLPSNYKLTVGISHMKSGVTIDWVEGVSTFKVGKISYNMHADYPWDSTHGYVEPVTQWNYSKK